MDLRSVTSHHVFANTLLFFGILAVLPIAVDSIHTHNDQEALLAFKEKVILDPFGSLSSWNFSVPLCQWYGVTCGHRHRTRVIQLELRYQSLTGSLSPYIGNLSFLKVLDLANNRFTQNIPSELGHLTRLRHLFLHNNLFEGEIPSNISACSRLVKLQAGNNKIYGTLPMELGSLSMLQVLSFNSNKLVGEIPASYGNLSSVQLFFLDGNSLSGHIPYSLGKLAKLIGLIFNFNSFSGLAPFSLFNISSLVALDLSQNQLLGTIPRDLGTTLPKIEFLSISHNHFSGSLPSSLANMSSLQYLEISYNKFSGEVPNFSMLHKLHHLGLSDNQFNNGKVNDLQFISSLTNATGLTTFLIQHNGFVGRLSCSSFKNLSRKFRYLDLSGNKIYGNIPVWISSYVNLIYLGLSENQLSGIIPQEIGKLQRLQYLYFTHNNITGFIPSSISNMTFLTELYLNKNNLEDKIPSSLGRCENLLYLFLNGNNLIGSIAREVFNVSSLVQLNLSDNQLSGELPEEVGNLKNLVGFGISSNKFRSEIPSNLGRCVTLEFLYMQRNLLQGIIPSSFEALKSLELLDLSNNNLSGQIPKFLKDFNLKLLNLSFNDFEGPIPEGGIFQNLSVVSVANNTKLCGGFPAQQLQKCSSNKKHPSKFVSSATFKLVSSLVLGLFGLVIVLSLLLIFRSKRKPSTHNSNTNPNPLLMVTYQGLLKATNDFSEINLIGIGSYGSVYKGILDDHLVVAVKVLNLAIHGAFKSFMAECDVLRNIRHRNLVKVLTACLGVDYNCNEFKALIYEFMANGNLDEWLHQNPQKNDNNTSKRLGFSQRLNIAIDVANALDYLHSGCETSIVHCDLKPSNVLLDNELVAHVGDFGLARSLPQETNSSIVKGSTGYTALEYGMGSKPSTDGDVYSFGILLLEMFTGKRPTNDMFVDLTDLHHHVKNALPSKVVEVVDPRILEDWETYDKMANMQENVKLSQETQKQTEGLISIFRLGVACSSPFINKREIMKDVVQTLCTIRDVYTS